MNATIETYPNPDTETYAEWLEYQAQQHTAQEMKTLSETLDTPWTPDYTSAV